MQVKLYHCPIKNFGDALSPYLVKLLAQGCPYAEMPLYRANLMAVGSILYAGEGIVIPYQPLNSFSAVAARLHILDRYRFPALNVWGSGFLDQRMYSHRPYQKRKLIIRATRGSLTRDILSSYGIAMDVASVKLGDPGLLYKRLLKMVPEKKYDIGILPHYSDAVFGRYICDHYLAKGVNAVYIDASAENPISVIESIASCETILSSSLHGCIVADSFDIPNAHIALSDLGRGDSFLFKFKDYYSAFGEEMPEMLTVNQAMTHPSDCVKRIRQMPRRSCDKMAELESGLIHSFKEYLGNES